MTNGIGHCVIAIIQQWSQIYLIASMGMYIRYEEVSIEFLKEDQDFIF